MICSNVPLAFVVASRHTGMPLRHHERHGGAVCRAFGCGVDRVAMFRYGIPYLRLLMENDMRFLTGV